MIIVVVVEDRSIVFYLLIYLLGYFISLVSVLLCEHRSLSLLSIIVQSLYYWIIFLKIGVPPNQEIKNYYILNLVSFYSIKLTAIFVVVQAYVSILVGLSMIIMYTVDIKLLLSVVKIIFKIMVKWLVDFFLQRPRTYRSSFGPLEE